MTAGATPHLTPASSRKAGKVFLDFPDKWAAIVWMCRNQLGRRNLTEAQKSYLRGKQYEAEKMTQGTNNQYVQAKSENGQNVHFHSRREIKDGTAGRIGKEYGVNGRTIRRDADFAKGVDLAVAWTLPKMFLPASKRLFFLAQ